MCLVGRGEPPLFPFALQLNVQCARPVFLVSSAPGGVVWVCADVACVRVCICVCVECACMCWYVYVFEGDAMCVCVSPKVYVHVTQMHGYIHSHRYRRWAKRRTWVGKNHSLDVVDILIACLGDVHVCECACQHTLLRAL